MAGRDADVMNIAPTSSEAIGSAGDPRAHPVLSVGVSEFMKFIDTIRLSNHHLSNK